MIIIPEQPANVGDIIEFEGAKYKVDQHFSQGKDMVGLYKYMMFDNKGAFGLVPYVAVEESPFAEDEVRAAE